MAQQRSEEYWNREYDGRRPQRFAESERPDVRRALQFFGDVAGKRVLDLGCGLGEVSLMLAARGADVTAIDLSDVAIRNLDDAAKADGLPIKAIIGNALQIAEYGPFDYVIGSMILHHIEPFGDFVDQLDKALAPKGRAFFWENSAASRLLVWFRMHVVGKLWIPKYGDADEFPVTPQEVDLLRTRFAVVREIPEMIFFRLVGVYISRGFGGRFFGWLDNFLFRRKMMTGLSYHQYLLIEKG